MVPDVGQDTVLAVAIWSLKVTSASKGRRVG
jgi:hypothetical protein